MIRFKHHNDWYKLQKNTQGWDELTPDQNITDLIDKMQWTVDVSLSHDNIKEKTNKHSSSEFDFFVLTDIEMSKLPLSELINIIQEKYNQSKHGGYIALLSYFLNPDNTDIALPESYVDSIKMFINNKLSFVNKLQECSIVVDQPIEIMHENGTLVEGNNFLFVHPNIRYFLWK